MTESSDPGDVTDALDAVVDAFDETGAGIPTREARIDAEFPWTTQLTKACTLLDLLNRIEGREWYTARIELAFGAIERSLEAYALSEGGDRLLDFQTQPHTHCYVRAAELGLLSRTTTDLLVDVYDDNRTDSYYGGRRPTKEQATAMHRLADAIHDHARSQVREGGVCTCDQ